jgi:hypothetical protein
VKNVEEIAKVYIKALLQICMGRLRKTTEDLIWL